MLLLTDDTVYHLPLNPQGPPAVLPQPILTRRRVLFAVEGRRYRVFLLPGNEMLVLEGKAEARYATGVAEPITSLAILNERPLTLALGTEPPRLYRWAPGLGEPHASMSFDRLAVRSQWHTPWGGPAAVRSLAVTGDGWIFADIHVGSIMRSADGGQIWEPVAPTLDEDVHQVAVSAGGNRGVYANTANGVWISRDRGESWAYFGDRMGGRYGRAIAVHPKDASVILATVSDGPHGEDVHGQLYRTEDGGANWKQIVEGFVAATPGNIDTHHLVFDARGDAWAIVGDQLYHGRFAGRQWRPYWQAPQALRLLATYA